MDNPNPEPSNQPLGGFDGSSGDDNGGPIDLSGSDEGGEDLGGGDEKPFNLDKEPFDAGVEADENTDPTKFIQQLSGKLGQSIRNNTEKQGQADLELEKFAINSVISATHTADMSPEDKNDIIKKINSSGEPVDADKNDDGVGDDFGDAIGGVDEPADEEPTEENIVHENSGIEILPKDHKQVFADAKLGVDETENKKSEETLEVGNKLSIFGENNNNFKSLIMKKINEMVSEETPTIAPPIVKPDVVPTRRQKPWKISPNPDPEPKAEE